jgi:hypothetical protein
MLLAVAIVSVTVPSKHVAWKWWPSAVTTRQMQATHAARQFTRGNHAARHDELRALVALCGALSHRAGARDSGPTAPHRQHLLGVRLDIVLLAHESSVRRGLVNALAVRKVAAAYLRAAAAANHPSYSRSLPARRRLSAVRTEQRTQSLWYFLEPTASIIRVPSSGTLQACHSHNNHASDAVRVRRLVPRTRPAWLRHEQAPVPAEPRCAQARRVIGDRAACLARTAPTSCAFGCCRHDSGTTQRSADIRQHERRSHYALRPHPLVDCVNRLIQEERRAAVQRHRAFLAGETLAMEDVSLGPECLLRSSNGTARESVRDPGSRAEGHTGDRPHSR